MGNLFDAFNHVEACENCHDNIAVMQIFSGSQRTSKKLCVVCAYKLGYVESEPELKRTLETMGITAENAELFNTRMADFQEMFPGGDPQAALAEMFGTSNPEELEAKLEDSVAEMQKEVKRRKEAGESGNLDDLFANSQILDGSQLEEIMQRFQKRSATAASTNATKAKDAIDLEIEQQLAEVKRKLAQPNAKLAKMRSDLAVGQNVDPQAGALDRETENSQEIAADLSEQVKEKNKLEDAITTNADKSVADNSATTATNLEQDVEQVAKMKKSLSDLVEERLIAASKNSDLKSTAITATSKEDQATNLVAAAALETTKNTDNSDDESAKPKEPKKGMLAAYEENPPQLGRYNPFIPDEEQRINQPLPKEALENVLDAHVAKATPKEAKEADMDSSRIKVTKAEELDADLKNLNKYAMNLNAACKAGKIDRLIGRDEELARVIQILNRRSKNNPVLLGEPGVGKTAIAEGLAAKIVAGEVPGKLQDFQVYLLDMTALVAGTQFRGQFENRLKGVVEDVIKSGRIILVIDELHNIMGAGNAEGAMNAANILKPALARGELRVLGSTTLSEYRKSIEKDSALERRFQPVLVEEPDKSATLAMLYGKKDYLESHHYVSYPDSVLLETVNLAERYVHDRFFPDKAIDILDEAGSKANLNNEILTAYQQQLKAEQKYTAIVKRLEEMSLDGEASESLYVLIAENKAKLAQIKAEITNLEAKLKRPVITFNDVAAVIEQWTGIPLKSLDETESDRLLALESRLINRVIGQTAAIKALTQAIKRQRLGFGKRKKPVSFIFVGPTGVGKTELVKALAAAMFDAEDAYIRLDMSEYMESHTVSKMIGSPPGYVGYDDGGQLTEKVRRHPYSVILLDEIEKAHQDVFNILLQVLDEGRLTDSHGRKVNFENTIIIMTSNAGTSSKLASYGFGNTGYTSLERRVEAALRETFKPEFLNRVDDVIVFTPLNPDELRKIIDLMLKEINQCLADRKLVLQVSDETKNLLAALGYDERYGARPLRKTLMRYLEDPLADLCLVDRLSGIKEVTFKLGQEANQKCKNYADLQNLPINELQELAQQIQIWGDGQILNNVSEKDNNDQN